MILTVLLLVIAQNPAQDPRYDRLDPDTRARVVAIVDSARDLGLPSEPLIHRALEGAMKNAPGERIVVAVRRLADLAAARPAPKRRLRSSKASRRCGPVPRPRCSLACVKCDGHQ
jgi:hypothetical protein